MADFFWFGRIDFRRRVAFVRLLSCFRLGRRVRLGINMVSVKSCGFEAFIPARAGEPSAPANHGVRQWVYPRACGGTPSAVPAPIPAAGLSPHVRGNPATRAADTSRIRSIPRIASNQMLPNFGRTRSLGRFSHEMRDGWPASSARPAATHRRTCFGRSSCRPSILLILAAVRPRVIM